MVGSQVGDAECARAYKHLRFELPFLTPLIDATGELPLPSPRPAPVASSLVHVVAGQMLSRAAANTIIARMRVAAEKTGVAQLYELDELQLRACGMSHRKAKTIAAIRELATLEGERLEGWRELDWPALRREVSRVWGLSDWSAGMLAIFDFGLPDVFPLGDGSLLRAMQAIERIYLRTGMSFPHARGSPYGSYLAITLWAGLDDGHLS